MFIKSTTPRLQITDGNMKRAGLQSTNLSNRTNFETRENK